MALKEEFCMAIGDIRKTIRVGKDEDYSSDKEMEKPIPSGEQSGQEVDDFLVAIRTRGLDVLEDEPQLPYSALERRIVADPDEIDVTPAPVAPESASDPVRVYLREMGASPLLTREGEVEIAKRIERGQLSAMRALSRSPIVIHEILDMGENLKLGLRSIEDTVVFDEEEVTEKILQQRAQEIRRSIDEVRNNYRTARRLAEQLVILSADKKTRSYRRCRSQLSRQIIRISLIIRGLDIVPSERKR